MIKYKVRTWFRERGIRNKIKPGLQPDTINESEAVKNERKKKKKNTDENKNAKKIEIEIEIEIESEIERRTSEK